MSRKKRAMPNKTLNPAIDGDILELAVMRRMYEMAKKQEYLKQHRYRKFFWILDQIREKIPSYNRECVSRIKT
jgi:hypothetical protein